MVYEKWIGHALIAIISLVLMVYALTTGALLKRRIKKKSQGNVFKFHKSVGIYFGALILGSFIYGLWIRLQHGESILSSVHGKLGLIILLTVVLQIFPSLVFKNRARYRGLHKMIGYALAPILVIDAGWGLHNDVIGRTKSLVLMHSVSGDLAALALVWIIIEMLYPTDRSLARARIASYLTAFLITQYFTNWIRKSSIPITISNI